MHLGWSIELGNEWFDIQQRRPVDDIDTIHGQFLFCDGLDCND